MEKVPEDSDKSSMCREGVWYNGELAVMTAVAGVDKVCLPLAGQLAGWLAVQGDW